MTENKQKEFEIRIIPSSISSLFTDDVEHQTLSPLSCLIEYGTYWLLEFDLPLVNKKDIKITSDENSISVEAKLKETYFEEKFGRKTEFEYFKKSISLPGKIDSKRITAKFEKGRLEIIIPKTTSSNKITIN